MTPDDLDPGPGPGPDPDPDPDPIMGYEPVSDAELRLENGKLKRQVDAVPKGYKKYAPGAWKEFERLRAPAS